MILVIAAKADMQSGVGKVLIQFVSKNMIAMGNLWNGPTPSVTQT